MGELCRRPPPSREEEPDPWPTKLSTSGSTGWSPRRCIRSKTKIIADDAEPGIWGFDGSSTEQAPGDKSDCVLKPVYVCADPLRGRDNVLVMAEVLLVDGKPHPTNTRAACEKVAKKYAKQEPLFGIEQEYTMLKASGRPLGFPEEGYPGPQGPYYCGVGTGRIMGRDIVEVHTQACIDAGLSISGTNPEVMPGQWEFQIGPVAPPAIGDQMYVARWLLHRIAEDFDVIISFDAKPEKGDWNGAGAHTNFSTNGMREDYDGDREGGQGPRVPSGSCTSRTTAPASRSASPASTRRRRGTSSATAYRTGARRCASRGRWPRTAGATSRTGGRTPTSIRTRWPA